MTAPAMTGMLIHPDGTWDQVEGTLGLRELQKRMGGYVQAVPVEWNPDGSTRTTVWCNEDGMALDLPLNPGATRLWWQLNPAMANRDMLLGTVLFTGEVQESGYGPVAQDVVDKWQSLTAT